MKAIPIALLAVVLLAGCDSGETYQGKSEGEWIKLAKDKDLPTRTKAIEALSAMKSNQAKAAVEDAAKNDIGPVRDVALLHCNTTLASADLLAVLQRIADEDTHMETAPGVTTGGFIGGVERLKAQASPLLPDLRIIVAMPNVDDARKEIIKNLIVKIEQSPRK